MEIRTRKELRSKRGRAGKVYDATRYLATGGPKVSYARDGRQVVESYPKNIFLPAISRSGSLVNIPLLGNPSNRNYGDTEALKVKKKREGDGFIWAHECPIASAILHPEDERALFGEDAKRCEGHDFGFVPGEAYKPPQLCPHLEKIAQVRRDTHNANMKRFGGATAKRETERETLAALKSIASTMQQSPARTRKSRDG